MSPKIHGSFWTDDDVWELTPEAKLAVLWLITNGNVDNAGCLELSPRQFSIETRMDEKALDGAIKALPRAFVKVGRKLWIRNWMKHQWTAGERSVTSRLHKSIVNAIAAMPIELRVHAMAQYPEFDSSLKALSYPLKALPVAEGPSKGLEGPRAEQSRAEQSRVFGERDERGGGPAVLVTWEMARGYQQTLLKQGADYSEAEAHSAWLHFQSTREAETGRWIAGRKVVGDWRAALEDRMQTLRRWSAEKINPAVGPGWAGERVGPLVLPGTVTTLGALQEVVNG